MSTYDDCVKECESRGTGCWGLQMVTYNDGQEVCQFILTREPTSEEELMYAYDSSNASILRKLTQLWDEESERCMGLIFDPNTFTLEECRLSCALDGHCEVYQWYWKTLEDGHGHGECFKGKDIHDCSATHALAGFEVVEGYRKQVSGERRVLASSDMTTEFPTESPTAGSGPTAIPAYQLWANKAYSMMAVGRDSFLVEMPYMSTYDDCVKECESRGTGCWGLQMVTYSDGQEVCQFILTREPTSEEELMYAYDSSNASILRKLTQLWDEESERCMGLTFDPN